MAVKCMNNMTVDMVWLCAGTVHVLGQAKAKQDIEEA